MDMSLTKLWELVTDREADIWKKKKGGGEAEGGGIKCQDLYF